jgi:hypothetical protein
MGVIGSDHLVKPIGFSRSAMAGLEAFWRSQSDKADLWQPVFAPYEHGYCHVDLDAMQKDQLTAFLCLVRDYLAVTTKNPDALSQTLANVVLAIEEVRKSK